MKKGFSIIEILIFIIIIGFITSQIPTMMEIINKKNAFSKTEDGVFNTLSLIDNIRYLPWDIQNTEYRDIIKVPSDNINFDCNFSREFGFQNRTCANNLTIQTSNSKETLDGWNDINTTTIHNGIDVYNIVSKVSFVDDDIFVNTPETISIDLTNVPEVVQSNIKKIRVYSVGEKMDDTNFLVEDLNYFSTNIGVVLIEKRIW